MFREIVSYKNCKKYPIHYVVAILSCHFCWIIIRFELLIPFAEIFLEAFCLQLLLVDNFSKPRKVKKPPINTSYCTDSITLRSPFSIFLHYVRCSLRVLSVQDCFFFLFWRRSVPPYYTSSLFDGNQTQTCCLTQTKLCGE